MFVIGLLLALCPVFPLVISSPANTNCLAEFPIPEQKYDNILDLLRSMGIGDAAQRDCQLTELGSDYSALKCLEGQTVNLDELDYLAKRLDSLDKNEAAQFEASLSNLGLSDMTDIINLTFCCQQATVITDFSDLEKVGKTHFLTVQGGCAPKDELDALDGYETALLLIGSRAGVVPPYDVLYDNGMKLEQIYDGRSIPVYYHDSYVDGLEGFIAIIRYTLRYDPYDGSVYVFRDSPGRQTV